jgi:hypothetical protein
MERILSSRALYQQCREIPIDPSTLDRKHRAYQLGFCRATPGNPLRTPRSMYNIRDAIVAADPTNAAT